MAFDYSKLSDEELEQIAQGSQPQSSNTQSMQRNWGDTARDLSYGVAQGTVGTGEFLANQLTRPLLGRPAAHVDLEWIKSPKPSLGGKALQMIGEYGIPAYGEFHALQGLAKTKAGAKVLDALTPLSKKLAGKRYQAVDEAIKTLQPEPVMLPKEHIKDVLNTLKKGGHSVSELAPALKKGNWETHLEVNSLLGKMSRNRKLENDLSNAAEYLKAKHMTHIKTKSRSPLQQEVSNLLEHAQKGYRQNANVTKGFKKIGAGAAALGGMSVLNKYIKNILGGH